MITFKQILSRSTDDRATAPTTAESVASGIFDRLKRFWARPILRNTALATIGVVAALRLDHTVWTHAHDVSAETDDMLRLFRACGYLPTWIAVGLALVLNDWPKRAATCFGIAARNGVLVILGAAGGGVSAEVLKLLIRRARPPKGDGAVWDGLFTHVPFGDGGWSTSGLSMPSSHASVAFGAVWMLCLLFPRATPVFLIFGVGCAATRVLDGAHYLSDVYLAATVTLGISIAIKRWYDAHQVRTNPHLDLSLHLPRAASRLR